MQARLLVVVGMGVVLLGSTVPEFWNVKPVSDWTREEAQQMMTSSPWAKEKPLPISERPNVSYIDGDPTVSASTPPSAELGNLPATGGTKPVGRTPSLSSAPVGAPLRQPVLRIVWASAVPVRLAALRLRLPQSAPSATQLADVAKDWENYVIAVVGLAPPVAGSDPKALATGAFLSVHGKPPERAFDSNYRRIGNSDVYFFRFTKAVLPIAPSDGEAEFKLTVGTMSLTQKFRLADMEYQHRLAL